MDALSDEALIAQCRSPSDRLQSAATVSRDGLEQSRPSCFWGTLEH
jgi:hypothetical protein